MAEIKKIEFNEYMVDEHARTKVTTMGNVIELTTTTRPSRGSPCIKLDKDHYLDCRTGEVLEYDHIDDRSGSKRSIYNTMEHIRCLVNTNVTEPKNVRWLTLTYAENMTDTERLYTDFKRFMTRLRRWCEKNGHGRPEYISVIEPQARGAWHAHLFLLWDAPAPYIDNNTVVSPLWGQGYTKTKALGDCDNIGAYFSAYLADLPYDELDLLPAAEKEKALFGNQVTEKAYENEQGLIKEKKFIKGGRLYMYPVGMNIVRTSRGVKQPVIEIMPRCEAKEKVSSAKLTYSCGYVVSFDDLGSSSSVFKSYYNTKRR